MAITVEAVYENGVLKPAESLPLNEHEKVRLTVEREQSPADRGYGMLKWTGSHEELGRLINGDDELDDAEDLRDEPDASGQSRPYGLCAGQFTVPKDFNDPLPEETLRDFEGR